MTAHVYPQALAGLRDGTLDWTADDIVAILLGPSFVYDSALTYVDQLPSQHVLGTSSAMANRTFDNGLAFGNAPAVLQLTSNQEISQIILAQDTGDPAYSLLIAHYDADSIIGAPKPADGQDEYVYALLPPGGYFQFTDEELVGVINSHLLAANVALGELTGGVSISLPDILLGSRLNVHTHVVCANAPGSEDCCEPTIRSSRCE